MSTNILSVLDDYTRRDDVFGLKEVHLSDSEIDESDGKKTPGFTNFLFELLKMIKVLMLIINILSRGD